MCGLAGWIGSDVIDARTEERVLSALHHRGPDAHGKATGTGWGLLHTRLSILDTSHAADQPFRSEDHSVLVVFNGEIYNHRDLRRGLEARGHTFRTRCDTEILPALYLEEGEDFASSLRGMFAIALLDTRTQTLHLARDRFGIKPLFVADSGTSLFFASEIAALSSFPRVDLRPDPQAIADFVALHVTPGPSTFYRGVENLEPGARLTVRREGRSISRRRHRFHCWRVAPDPSLTPDKAAAEAAELVDLAVSAQLESDVPLGALLSGGIDSSLIASAARSALPDLRTFSVRFKDPEFDESSAANWVAEHISSTHKVLEFEGAAPEWDDLTATLRQCGQPFADTSLFAVDALCRLVRANVTVALAGDGGDEGFGGYDHYLKLPAIARVLGTVPRWVRQVAVPPATAATALVARAGLAPTQLPTRLRDLAATRDFPDALANLGSWIRPREFDRLWTGPRVEGPRRLFCPTWEHDLPTSAPALERLAGLAVEVDVRVRMANDYLPKVDTASMRSSLEVRVPMLDEELFDLGLRLPYRLRTDDGVTKRVLRDVASQSVPGIAGLPKHGFGVPVDTWMPPAIRARLRREVGRPGGPVRDFVSADWINHTLDHFVAGSVPAGVTRQGLYQRAVMLLSLHLFLSGG
jgi:asparagine synthase (glutamine-hydrolysing)